ncbi:MAG TPA: four helix bundle protein [Saprospiraceae bacterium]|nr:four helix bundle protein [Saprospiraceae bacterium]
MTYFFEKLEIWQLSIDFSVEIYNVTIDFPSEEKFGVTNQIRRASNSVSANIAEGSSRLGNKERARFYQIAYSSLMEVLSFLILSNRLNFLSTSSFTDLRIRLEELSNKINSYYKTIEL